jgi:hypothetical protein
MRAISFAIALAALLLGATRWTAGAHAQQPSKTAAAPKAETGNGPGSARLLIYHKCLNLTLLTGIKVPAADHYIFVGDKKLGATPLCSVRSFQVPAGQHVVSVKDWSGIGFNFVERSAQFPSGGTVHLLIDKGQGGSAYWAQITPLQARNLAREIDGINKK